MNNKYFPTIVKITLLAVVLYFFLTSIKLMGTSFKLFGTGFAEELIKTTSNPFVGLFIGILATSIMQSSSSTTSILVGLVAAGAIPLRAAIPIIMGANIGTTITNTLVSLGNITRKQEFEKAVGGATIHDFFNIIAVLILFPLEYFTHVLEKSASFLAKLFFGFEGVSFTTPLDYIIKPAVDITKNLTQENAIAILVIALVILFLSLRFFTKLARSLIMTKAENLIDSYLFKTACISFIFGVILTMIVQSSSVTTSLVIPLLGAGIITIRKAFPYMLGSNIGTTVTAILASLATSNITAVVVAFSHLLFNILGITIIYPFREILIKFTEKFGKIAVKSKKLIFIYILVMFYLIPLILIFLFR